MYTTYNQQQFETPGACGWGVSLSPPLPMHLRNRRMRRVRRVQRLRRRVRLIDARRGRRHGQSTEKNPVGNDDPAISQGFVWRDSLAHTHMDSPQFRTSQS